MTQIVPTLLTYGLTQQTAVYVNLLVCVIACFGSWILGVVDTKQGSRRGMMITFVCLIGMGLLAQINYLPTKLVCFALLGIVVGGGSNFMLSSVMGYWGRTNGMKVYGFSQPCSQIISSFGSTIISAIAAAAGGNYNMSFLFIGILAVIGFILVFFIKDGFMEKREQKFK